jgi:peptide/nickel transport system substrate-binding protein
MGSDPGSLNPIFRGNVSQTYLLEIIFAFPFSVDWNFKSFADANVVESWETSEDGLMERVVLREDLTWSDGKPFTAGDIEFSFKTILDGRLRVQAVNAVASALKGVKALDRRTVLYVHKERLATNDFNMTWPVIPKHLFAVTLAADPTGEKSDEHRQYAQMPVSNGPYVMVSRDGSDIVIERRKEWHLNAAGETIRERPFFRRVRFRILPEPATILNELKAGGIDDGMLNAKQWMSGTTDDIFHADRTKVRDRQWAIGYIAWNAKSNPPNPFFQDVRVRRGLAHAIDHEFLLNDFFYGLNEGGGGPYHPASPAADRTLKPLRKDLALADRLLSEAGWTDSDEDGVRDKLIDGVRVPFRFTLSVPNSGTGPEVAQLVQADLKKAGVVCQIELLEFVAFSGKTLRREVQAGMQAMGSAADPDLLRNLFETSAIETGRNSTGYSNPKVDELFQKARRELDPAKRNVLYAQIDRQVYEDQPMTVLLYPPTLWAFSKSLRGYRHSPRGFYSTSPGFLSMWKKKGPAARP